MGLHRNNRNSFVLFIISMIVFGTIGLFRRWIPLSSGMLAFVRGLLGTVFLGVVIVLRNLRNKGSSGKIGSGGGLRSAPVLWLFLSGAAIGFNWILLFEAYNYTTVAVATLCYYMQPTIVILLSPFLLKERLTIKKTICAGAAILGMIFVSGVMEGNSAGTSLKGILFGLGAAALYASVIIMNKRIPPMDAYRKTMIQLFSATVVMIPYLILTEDFGQIHWGGSMIWLLLVVGIVHTGIAYTLYFASMEGLKGQTIAIFSYIDPVTALILSAFLLGETLSLTGIIGALLILGAAAFSEISGTGKNRQNKQQES